MKSIKNNKTMSEEQRAERKCYDIITKAYQNLEYAIDTLEEINPHSEELPTLRDYLNKME